MTSKDYAITNAMLRYGGSFAHAIATAAQVADDDNLAALKTALPKLWSHYEMMTAISPEQRLADEAIKISLDRAAPAFTAGHIDADKA